MEGKEPAPAATRVAAGASTDGVDEAVPADDALLHVPRGLWCYRVDRHRAVLGGALTDGGSVFEWLRSTLALAPGEDMAGVMEEAERMPPASHGLTVSASVIYLGDAADWLSVRVWQQTLSHCVHSLPGGGVQIITPSP